jgi:hypothetical protein
MIKSSNDVGLVKVAHNKLPKFAAKKSGWVKYSQGFAQQRSHLPLGKALAIRKEVMETKKININIKISASLLIVSGLFFYFNFALGDTIFANVIVLLVSGVTGLGAFVASIIGIYDERRNVTLYIEMLFSLSILVAIFLLFYTDNVAAGYGP